MPLLTDRRRRLVSAGWLAPALIAALVPTQAQPAGAQSASQPLRFVLIPKVSHPWYDAVRQGAETAGRMIQRQSGRPVVIDYQPPTAAQVSQQAQRLEAAIRSQADGITIDLLDGEGLRPLLQRARSAGIALMENCTIAANRAEDDAGDFYPVFFSAASWGANWGCFMSMRPSARG